MRGTRLFRPPFAAALEGTLKSKGKAKVKMDSGFRRNDVDGRVGYMRCVGFCGRDCRALLFPGPSRPRRAGAGKVARSAIARRMRASPMSVQGRTVSGPRSLLAKSQGHGCPCDRGREGVLFFGDFLLDKQKKVTG